MNSPRLFPLYFAALIGLTAHANPIAIDASSPDSLSFTVDLTDGHYDDTRTQWWLNGGQVFESSSADWAISQSVSVSGFGGILCIRSTGDIWGGFTFFPDWWFGANGPELGYGMASGCGFMLDAANVPVAETSGLVSRFTWGSQPAITFAATVATVPEAGSTLSLIATAFGVLWLAGRRGRLGNAN